MTPVAEALGWLGSDSSQFRSLQAEQGVLVSQLEKQINRGTPLPWFCESLHTSTRI